MSKTATLDQIRSCLVGGAIGDALGAPLEFLNLHHIHQKFGESGLTDYAPFHSRKGTITDDTQMMLFTLEGLLRANNRWLDRGICHVPTVVWHAYLRWLLTQREEPRYEYPDFVKSGWLFDRAELRNRRAPGNSCLGALIHHSGPADIEAPVNESKGCGGIMRIAPVGLIANEPFQIGIELAALTHGHPSGYLAAGFFAHVIGYLKDGSGLEESIGMTLGELKKWRGFGECDRAVRRALDFAQTRKPMPETIEALGGGWVAEETLAIALYCGLVAKDYREGVLLAVNHGGDSDSTGMLAGNLLGLIHGIESIPIEWIERLEVMKIINEMSEDAVSVFGEASKEASERQTQKYPPN